MKAYDLVVIGGGFFGCEIANHLSSRFRSVLIIEQSNGLMNRASYKNQARVHNGYHYPKSILTAIRSRVNFDSFCRDYHAAIYKNFEQFYAIGSQLSDVSSLRYQQFCKTIKASIAPAGSEIENLIAPGMTENIFKTVEYAFDATKIKKIVSRKLKKNSVNIAFDCFAERLVENKNGIRILTNRETFFAKTVINATYTGINALNKNSGLSILPLKHELTELLLMRVPPRLVNLGITIMCGPFFSLMPFPALNLHTLSHVRYTPHASWIDDSPFPQVNIQELLTAFSKRSAKEYMLADVCRYVPEMNKSEYVDSLWEIKTILPSSEKSDSRPILFHQSAELPGYFCVMGGKIDNIYDMWEELDNYDSFKI